jgi:hypothetical protein
VQHTDRWLDVLFGKGDDDFPFWLMTVRFNILLFLVCAAIVLGWNLTGARLRRAAAARTEIAVVLMLTALAAALRFLVASTNLMDYGGIPYSRLLLGYKGHFATAQLYSLFYRLTSRDIEHAIFLDQIAGTLTIPLVFVLCRQLQPANRLFPAIAALLFAVSPLHVLFSASDALPPFSIFLTVASYVLLAGDGGADEPPILRKVRYLGGLSGLALLTQVRYENALFFIPVALFALARRRSLRVGDLWPGVLAAAAFLAFYAFAVVVYGLSFQNPVVVSTGIERIIELLILNPFLAIPTLLLGTLAITVFGGITLGVLCLLPLPAAFALGLLADSGHGAARVFCGWLILILPAAAYGFSLLLASKWRLAQAVALLALIHLAVQPLLLHDRLTARHLEIRENDFFRDVLSDLPPGVERIIVPDDELLRRHSHSTNEVFNKYAMIVAGREDLARRPRLVSLTQFLEEPSLEKCSGDACLFFFGLPCAEQRVYPFAKEQCEKVLDTYRSSLLRETEMVAAPFLDCSIYSGEMYRRFCEPTVKRQRFAAYRIEG